MKQVQHHADGSRTITEETEDGCIVRMLPARHKQLEGIAAFMREVFPESDATTTAHKMRRYAEQLEIIADELKGHRR